MNNKDPDQPGYLHSMFSPIGIHFLENIIANLVQIQRGDGVRTPLKNHKNIGFSSKTGPDPLKNSSYQANIQCWAIIGTPGKCHFMAFRWQANDSPLIVVLESSLPSSTKKKKKKKKKKHCQSWTPSDKTFWIRAC